MYGNIGTADRLDFTVIGPAVNLTSRLEGLCRVLGLDLLVSDTFAGMCGVRRLPLARDPRSARDLAAGRGVHPARSGMTPLQRLARRLGYDLTPRRKAKATRTPSWSPCSSIFGSRCVLDVGANVGQYGALLREWGYPGRIVSFEPQAEAQRALERRAAADPDWQVAPRMALGARDGEVELEVSAESDMSSILPQGALLRRLSPSSAVVRKETVPLRRLDGVAGAYLADRGPRRSSRSTRRATRPQVLAGAAGLLERLAGIQLEMALVPLYEGERPFRAMLDRARGARLRALAVPARLFRAQARPPAPARRRVHADRRDLLRRCGQ